ncbi:MAG: pseudaminic acid cytidylyltransferase [Roseburia sp.]|nr:pseudaminic acid cytidylyltransferase [Roseburia sp.]
MSKTVAIITARGGSKRIPRKNIKEFCEKPIIAYSIESAIESGVFDEVMVSTDDEEIAGIAKQYGAKVPFMRSVNTANDYATTADVICEVLEEYRAIGKVYEYACCIYPTAPFVTAEKLKTAMELLVSTEADSVMPVTAFSFPPMRGMYIREDMLSYAFPEYSQKRSQDIEAMYHDCGQFYCFEVERFMETKKLVTENTRPIIVSELEVQDIDNEIDWKLAELKYQMMKEGK